MKPKLTSLLIAILLLTACAAPPPTQDPASIQATAEAMAWQSVTQTAQAIPTNTLPPTATPIPTETPIPTATPAPLIFQGTGDSVVDVPKDDSPMVARISHSGFSNFSIWNVDASGERLDLLVNTIGSYQGSVPVDFLDDEHTARFEISADGAWQIELLPLELARFETIPGVIQGTGDDVILLVGDDPDLLKVDASAATSNIAIIQYSDRRNLLVNEIAPYTGTVAMDRNAVLITISATGPWSLEITTR